jgi:hypothetical protein
MDVRSAKRLPPVRSGAEGGAAPRPFCATPVPRFQLPVGFGRAAPELLINKSRSRTNREQN